MKKTTVVLVVTIFSLSRIVSAQGFVNLDFESANVSAYGAGPASVPATDGIPGWTAYMIFGGNATPQSNIIYNSVSLGAASIDLQGPGSGYSPIQGNYFVLLQGNTDGQGVAAGIGQTGTIPADAMSMIFWGNDMNAVITFDGQPLAVNAVGTTGNYSIYDADISQYAGQTGELLFTADGTAAAAAPDFLFLDNIQFSPDPVPEPGTLALVALGASLLGFRRRNSWR